MVKKSGKSTDSNNPTNDGLTSNKKVNYQDTDPTYIGADISITTSDLASSKPDALISETNKMSYTTKTTFPGTNISVGTNTTFPGTNISTGTNTTFPGTNISTGTNTTFPGTNISTGTNTTFPGTNISTDTNSTFPGTNISTGTNTTFSGTNISTGTNTTFPGTNISTGTNTTFSGTNISTGTNTTFSGTNISTGTNTTFPGTNISTGTNSTFPGTNISTGTNTTFSGTNISTGTNTTHQGANISDENNRLSHSQNTKITGEKDANQIGREVYSELTRIEIGSTAISIAGLLTIFYGVYEYHANEAFIRDTPQNLIRKIKDTGGGFADSKSLIKKANQELMSEITAKTMVPGISVSLAVFGLIAGFSLLIPPAAPILIPAAFIALGVGVVGTIFAAVLNRRRLSIKLEQMKNNERVIKLAKEVNDTKKCEKNLDFDAGLTSIRLFLRSIATIGYLIPAAAASSAFMGGFISLAIAQVFLATYNNEKLIRNMRGSIDKSIKYALFPNVDGPYIISKNPIDEFIMRPDNINKICGDLHLPENVSLKEIKQNLRLPQNAEYLERLKATLSESLFIKEFKNYYESNHAYNNIPPSEGFKEALKSYGVKKIGDIAYNSTLSAGMNNTLSISLILLTSGLIFPPMFAVGAGILLIGIGLSFVKAKQYKNNLEALAEKQPTNKIFSEEEFDYFHRQIEVINNIEQHRKEVTIDLNKKNKFTPTLEISKNKKNKEKSKSNDQNNKNKPKN